MLRKDKETLYIENIYINKHLGDATFKLPGVVCPAWTTKKGRTKSPAFCSASDLTVVYFQLLSILSSTYTGQPEDP